MFKRQLRYSFCLIPLPPSHKILHTFLPLSWLSTLLRPSAIQFIWTHFVLFDTWLVEYFVFYFLTLVKSLLWILRNFYSWSHQGKESSKIKHLEIHCFSIKQLKHRSRCLSGVLVTHRSQLNWKLELEIFCIFNLCFFICMLCDNLVRPVRHTIFSSDISAHYRGANCFCLCFLLS